MRMKSKVTGARAIAEKLRHAGKRVSENGRKVMHRTADKIVKLAKLQAPVDKHNLEESIEQVVSYGVRGRLQIDITAGGTVNGVNVSKYAVAVHENYDRMGPGTIEKQKQNPQVMIGRKFLERAVDHYEDELRGALIASTHEAWSL